jgi:uncharacterized protein YndB with AHSA1/START domain
MPVTEVLSGWRLGRPFHWKCEMNGHASEVRGSVLRLEVDRLLEYDYLDPISPQRHRHLVTIELTDAEGGTRVSVLQDNNGTHAELADTEGGWRLALHNLKALSEKLQRERVG